MPTKVYISQSSMTRTLFLGNHLITYLVSERLDHGEVGDNLERVDILDEDVAGDVFELDVVQEDGHFLAELGGISITVVLTPH